VLSLEDLLRNLEWLLEGKGWAKRFQEVQTLVEPHTRQKVCLRQTRRWWIPPQVDLLASLKPDNPSQTVRHLTLSASWCACACVFSLP
jgi:hypothetical protein